MCALGVDGQPSSAGPITHEVSVQLQIYQHLETLILNITKLGTHDLILGKTWLRRHNPPIDWARQSISFMLGVLAMFLVGKYEA